MAPGAFEQGLVIVVVIVLVPLVPAWILYRYLPSRTLVTGPFKGLQLKLTGAFAGYFVIALFCFGVIRSYVEPVRADLNTRYVLQGRAQLAGADGDLLDSRRLSLVLLPRGFSREREAADTIRWDFSLRAPTDSSGTVHWPYEAIQLEYPGYLPQRIDFPDFQQAEEVFTLPETVVLEPDPLLETSDE